MVYRYKLSRNLRLLLLPGVSVLFVIASLAGEFSYQVNEKEVFLYSDENDYLIRIPFTYSNPGDLTREIEEYSGEFVRWQGQEHGDLEVRLRERFAAEKT